jgi:hypothetical protein
VTIAAGYLSSGELRTWNPEEVPVIVIGALRNLAAAAQDTVAVIATGPHPPAWSRLFGPGSVKRDRRGSHLDSAGDPASVGTAGARFRC